MTSTGARISKLAKTLTARESAVLSVRFRLRDPGAAPDWRIDHLRPVTENEEYDRIFAVLNEFIIRLNTLVPAWYDEVRDIDRQIAWVESLNELDARCAALTGELKQAKLKPSRWERGRLDHGVGDAGADGRTSVSFAELPTILLKNIAEDVRNAFQNLEAFRTLIEEFSQAELDGAWFIEQRHFERFAKLEQVLCDSLPRLRALGIEIERMPATAEYLAKLRKYLHREPPPAPTDKEPVMRSRWGLTEQQRTELKALEEWLVSTRKPES
jgi:hypothetical protein